MAYDIFPVINIGYRYHIGTIVCMATNPTRDLAMEQCVNLFIVKNSQQTVSFDCKLSGNTTNQDEPCH
jgi:hypothetical protein